MRKLSTIGLVMAVLTITACSSDSPAPEPFVVGHVSLELTGAAPKKNVARKITDVRMRNVDPAVSGFSIDGILTFSDGNTTSIKPDGTFPVPSHLATQPCYGVTKATVTGLTDNSPQKNVYTGSEVVYQQASNPFANSAAPFSSGSYSVQLAAGFTCPPTAILPSVIQFYVNGVDSGGTATTGISSSASGNSSVQYGVAGDGTAFTLQLNSDPNFMGTVYVTYSGAAAASSMPSSVGLVNPDMSPLATTSLDGNGYGEIVTGSPINLNEVPGAVVAFLNASSVFAANTSYGTTGAAGCSYTNLRCPLIIGGTLFCAIHGCGRCTSYGLCDLSLP